MPSFLKSYHTKSLRFPRHHTQLPFEMVGGCIHSTSEQRGQPFGDAAPSRRCDKARSSIMSTATRLGDRGGQRHVGKQAEAGGACSSEHGSCWSHAELCPSILRGVHPWDPLARPSVHPWWSRGCCVPRPPADVTSAWEGPVATHRRLPGPSARFASFAHIYIPEFLLLLYGGSR